MNRVVKGVYDFKEKIWTKISKDAKDLISQMLTKDINQRPSANEVIQHKWFQQRLEKEVVDERDTLDSLENIKNFRATQKLN